MKSSIRPRLHSSTTSMLCFLLLSFQGAILFADLKINEFMASNIYTQLNSDYSDFVDWIELYNAGTNPVSLDGYYLTDDLELPRKWAMPEGIILQPGEYHIIWADGENHDSHASFKLSEGGEEIGIFRSDQSVIDSVTFSSQFDDISYGRFPDGEDAWVFFPQPTAGSSNLKGINTAQRASRPEFSPEGGLASIGDQITLSTQTNGEIRYTLDGSIPDEQSTLYSDPIPVDSTTVICARIFQENLLPGKTVTHTYIVHESTSLPVISLTTPPEFLFDEDIGITVGVPVSDSLGAPPPFDEDANFWKRWERPVHIEYYDPEGVCGFAQTAGIKIFGGAFGRQIRQKAFSLFARNKYNDPDFDYPLFPTKSIQSFKRFLLRCSSNDFNRTYIRDAMMNTLVIGQMDVDWQAYQPAIVYINGVYWGLYNIREKTNQYYPESNYNIDVDDVDLIEGVNTVAHGDGKDYQDLLDYVKSNNLNTDSHYDYMKSQIDITAFMNYYITQLYVRNEDWLHQNIKCWRDGKSESKWRWLLYDMDWGFGGEVMLGEDQYTTNSIEWAQSQEESSTFFKGFMQNQKFKKEYLQRFATHLNLTFHPERVAQIIDRMTQTISPEMPRQIARWGAVKSLDYWQEQLQVLYEFAQNRPQYVFQHIKEASNSDFVNLTVEVSDSSAGYISIYNVKCPAPEFTGQWLKEIAIPIKAHANTGWRFVHFIGTQESNSDTVSMQLDENAIVHAVFEPGIEPLVISEIHYNPSSNLQGDDETYEFIEISNQGEDKVDLSNYYFSDGITFSFPENSAINPNEYIIIAKKAETYETGGYQIFQWTKGSLANEGESLCLRDSEGNIVDSITYDDKNPWPLASDGDGPSLELKDYTLDNSIASAWRASLETGGTPGKGLYSDVGTLKTGPLKFRLYPNYPNPFNPHTIIAFDLVQSGQTKIDIFNLRGELIETLEFQSMSAGYHSVTWNASEFPSGVYIIQLTSEKYRQVIKSLLIK